MRQDIAEYLREVRSQITRADEAADEIERLRAALEFYADPIGKCEQVPDFYYALDFGSTASAALKPR